MPGATIDDIGMIIDFVRWRSASGQGHLDESRRITAKSSNRMIESVFAGFEMRSGIPIEKSLK